MAEQACAERIRLAAEQQLRNDFPYLKGTALEEILDQISIVTRSGLKAQAPVMDKSKSRIGFFSLPAELRNQIYELALLPVSSPGRTPPQLVATNTTYINSPRPEPPKLPALLATSRQVRHEALPIYFGANRFRAELLIKETEHFDLLLSSSIWKWVHAIGYENASKIKHLEIKISTPASAISQFHADICRLADAVPWALGTPDGAHAQSWDIRIVKRALGLAFWVSRTMLFGLRRGECGRSCYAR